MTANLTADEMKLLNDAASLLDKLSGIHKVAQQIDESAGFHSGNGIRYLKERDAYYLGFLESNFRVVSEFMKEMCKTLKIGEGSPTHAILAAIRTLASRPDFLAGIKPADDGWLRCIRCGGMAVRGGTYYIIHPHCYDAILPLREQT